MDVFDYEAEGWDEWDDPEDIYEPPYSLDPLSWFDSPTVKPYFEAPPKCQACDYYLATDDGLCQFCARKLEKACDDIFEKFNVILSNHMDFARYLETRHVARPAA